MGAGAGAGAVKHVKPNFVLSEKEGARSNTDPATTRTAAPTFTGMLSDD
jgi:hypothetical protein